jgi:ketosteroid isomerase-like protein
MPDAVGQPYTASTPVEAVERFYRSLVAHDASAVEQFCAQWFDPEATLDFPESLPYGGQVRGAERIGRLFRGMCRGPGPTGPRGLQLLGVVGSSTRVYAELAFDYLRSDGALVATGAVELWRIAGGRVVAVEAYYRDTAALLTPG